MIEFSPVVRISEERLQRFPRGYREWQSSHTHRHAHAEVVVCMDGSHFYGINGVPLSLGPGEVVIIPPNVPHDSWYAPSQPACTDLWMHLFPQGRVWLRMLQNHPGKNLAFQRISFRADHQFDADFKRLCELVFADSNKNHGSCETRNAFLLFVIHRVFERLPEADAQEQKHPDHSVVMQMAEHICQNLAEDLPLAELARVAGYSPFHFHREFRKVIGVTPRLFLETERIKTACNLLKAGASVTAAAMDAGFTTCPQFNKTFKRHMGTTPTRWLMANDSNLRRRSMVLKAPDPAPI